jgi:hypothetical protein
MEGDGDPNIRIRFEAFWPLVNTVSVAAILLTLVMVPGFALTFSGHPIPGLPLIVGGIVLLTWWALVLPLIVIEQCSIGEAFNRSRELVAGHAWQVFGFLFVVGFLTNLLSTAVDRLSLALLPDPLALLLSTLFETAVVTPFLALALVSLYFTLIPKDTPDALPSPA